MTDNARLLICGDVERSARLTLAELRSMMDAEIVADFHCREGWSRLGERWRGVPLRTLLALAGAADEAGYVTVASGEYTAVQDERRPQPLRSVRATMCLVGHGLRLT